MSAAFVLTLLLLAFLLLSLLSLLLLLALSWLGWLGACGWGRWGANGRFSNEDGTGLDRQRFGSDIANDFGTGLEVDAVGGGHVAMNLAVNDNRSSFDFGLEAGVFAHGQIAFGSDFAFDFTIDHKLVGKLD